MPWSRASPLSQQEPLRRSRAGALRALRRLDGGACVGGRGSWDGAPGPVLVAVVAWQLVGTPPLVGAENTRRTREVPNVSPGQGAFGDDCKAAGSASRVRKAIGHP